MIAKRYLVVPCCKHPAMKKKFVLLAAAGLLTTASIVYASVAGEKKPAVVKDQAGARKEVKKSKCSGYKKSVCSGYYTRTT